MGRMRVKICGVTTPEVASAAADAGADAVGLVFSRHSPRAIRAREAQQVARAIPRTMEAVGLFVEGDEAGIRSTVEEVPLTMVQLHGGWDRPTIERLSPIRISRALRFDPDAAADRLREWDRIASETPHVVSVLWDTPNQGRPGGTGERFDWAALRAVLDDVRPDVPVVLAGGLTPDNVGEAVRLVRPDAVDVSSGVEVRRGVKDTEKVRAFCEAARASAEESP